ncbi:hypothetical protein FSO04_24190 [Paraburkholderia madseniana]|uniref:Terminase small subunit protein n=1 Tax=Paraburkholderia madseniana TaxID=2599607 RepID=A0A6N6WC50_9BURK|nr:hypothetical protein [Paraburkholderia madseniana]KAE8757324.1 hypothetical protein FSO04_24190 [Paraburkholderia madseniana]
MVASTFTQALFDKICDLIADGKSVHEICEAKGMPNRRTFHDWCRRTPELQAKYDAAYLMGEQSILDDIQYIADTEPDPAKARVRVDSRKWTLKVRNRKVYGDHVTEELTGPNGGPLQVVRLRMTPAEELPE